MKKQSKLNGNYNVEIPIKVVFASVKLATLMCFFFYCIGKAKGRG